MDTDVVCNRAADLAQAFPVLCSTKQPVAGSGLGEGLVSFSHWWKGCSLSLSSCLSAAWLITCAASPLYLEAELVLC